MNTRQWLEEVKAGEEVAIANGGGLGAGDSVGKVDKVTATQIVIGNIRYSKKDGYRIGERGYRRAYLRQLTPEIRETIRRETAVRYIVAYAGRTLKKADIATDLLEQIVAEMRKVKT